MTLVRRVTDAEFTPPAKSPFPPGTSPSRQKGNAYLGDYQYFDAVVPGGVSAVLKGVADDATRTFLSQKFRASDWYDAYPNIYLQQSAARILGLTFEEHRRRVGEWHAKFALNGVYRTLLKMVSNENVALWGPRISSLYFEFGRVDARITGPKEVSAIRRGVPKGLLQWLVWASAGFADASLRLAGARIPRTTFGDVETEGSESGQEICRIALRMTWE
jgi:hypothetical protein